VSKQEVDVQTAGAAAAKAEVEAALRRATAIIILAVLRGVYVRSRTDADV
jgi:hypothetical protein